MRRSFGPKLLRQAQGMPSRLEAQDKLSNARDRLHLIVQKLNIAPGLLYVLHHSGEDFVGMAAVVADTGDTQGQPLPELLVFYLSDGYVEFGTYSGDYGLGYLTFTFQALVPWQPQAHAANADMHT